MVSLDTKLVNVLGDRSAKQLRTDFDMTVVEDLIRHYPRRYIELGKVAPIGTLREGQHVTIFATVLETKDYRYGPGGSKVRTVITVGDEYGGRILLTFFGQRWLKNTVKPGQSGLFSGEVGSFNGSLQLTQPVMDLIDEEADVGQSRLSRGVLPVYAASNKVPTGAIERCVGLVLDMLDDVPDPLPDVVRAEHGLMDARQALESVHRPYSMAEAMKAQHRLRFEEAFVVQAVFAKRRLHERSRTAIARPPVDGGLRTQFEQRLPFTLTDGQSDVVRQLSQDLAQPHPMHRLLQGDVGSGKTIVALMAMLQVVDAGGQAAMLAPTEVLAAQHYRSITGMLGDLANAGMLGGADGATRVRLLTGSMGAKARKEALLDAASGAAGIVIGTHALIQEGVQFAELGLVVVDEQHRFGVEQRAALVDRAEVRPHVLVMTATPIPRTIAMTVFGDLETSVLRELPAGRQPIQTTVVPMKKRPAWLERGWQRLREEVAQGRQAYVVVSRIGDEDSTAETHSLLELHDELVAGPLKGLSVGILHGRMTPDDKEAAMAAFTSGQTSVLIATTVIEVGVDVPNATVMVIMDADRFGISQLHQLRGRIGRGKYAGLCLLVTDADGDTPARERLEAVASTTDGFELSMRDIELRREGDVLGTRQSGVRSSLRLLSVVRNGDVIEKARDAATIAIAADPEASANPALAAAMQALETTQQVEYLERT